MEDVIAQGIVKLAIVPTGGLWLSLLLALQLLLLVLAQLQQRRRKTRRKSLKSQVMTWDFGLFD
jgi:hypothetical protein